MINSLFFSISNRISSGAKHSSQNLLDLPLDNTQTDTSTTTQPIPSIRFEQASLNESCSHDYVAILRAKLRFFLMSPCWKWHLKRQIPWKAWFQFFKIIIFTTQVSFDLVFFFVK